jgi:uncharacterized protein (DUF952 family)
VLTFYSWKAAAQSGDIQGKEMISRSSLAVVSLSASMELIAARFFAGASGIVSLGKPEAPQTRHVFDRIFQT